MALSMFNLKRSLATIAALGAVATMPTGAASMQPIDGVYVDSGGFTQITVERCGAVRCGTITRILKKKPGEPNNDAYNNNPDLRSRPILGIRVLSQLRWDGDEWKGKAYNPEDGNTYTVYVRPVSGGQLAVKGCIAFLCRTQIWPAAR